MEVKEVENGNGTNKFKGWRKVLVTVLTQIIFVLAIWLLDLKDTGAIIAIGAVLASMMGVNIWGNVKSKQIMEWGKSLNGNGAKVAPPVAPQSPLNQYTNAPPKL